MANQPPLAKGFTIDSEMQIINSLIYVWREHHKYLLILILFFVSIVMVKPHLTDCPQFGFIASIAMTPSANNDYGKRSTPSRYYCVSTGGSILAAV